MTEPWMDDAACIGVDPDLFFPGHGDVDHIVAKQICRRCPVCDDCLAYALDHAEKFGIWGGTSERERRRIRTRRLRLGMAS